MSDPNSYPNGFHDRPLDKKNVFFADAYRDYVAGKVAASSKQDWPQPKPLPSGLLPVGALEYDCLPPTIARWVGDIAERSDGRVRKREIGRTAHRRE